MLEAFKSGESGETSESKARKALLFENEIVEESLRVMSGEDHVAIIHLQGDIQEIPALTKVVSIEGSKEMEEEIARKRSSVENDGKQTLDIGIKEDEVIGEMVAGLDGEDGNLEYEMMEDGEEEAGLDQKVSAETNSMEIEEAFPIDESVDLAEEKEHQIPKKKRSIRSQRRKMVRSLLLRWEGTQRRDWSRSLSLRGRRQWQSKSVRRGTRVQVQQRRLWSSRNQTMINYLAHVLFPLNITFYKIKSIHYYKY